MAVKKEVAIKGEEAVEAAAKVAKEQSVINEGTYIYIGPSLPKGKLKSNTVLQGEREEIEEHLKEILEEFPEVKRLIVPTSKLGESKAKLKAQGNSLYNSYEKVEATMRGEE